MQRESFEDIADAGSEKNVTKCSSTVADRQRVATAIVE